MADRLAQVRWLVLGEQALPAGTGWLTPAEAARAGAMRYPKRRTEYLLRPLAAKQAVAALARGAPLPAAPAPIEAANLIWSAKESALKVLRTGLRRDTRSVAVSLTAASGAAGGGAEGGGWWPLAVRCGPGPAIQGWWRRDGEFVLTVAAPGRCPR